MEQLARYRKLAVIAGACMLVSLACLSPSLISSGSAVPPRAARSADVPDIPREAWDQLSSIASIQVKSFDPKAASIVHVTESSTDERCRVALGADKVRARLR
jgi:hypothetical protein